MSPFTAFSPSIQLIAQPPLPRTQNWAHEPASLELSRLIDSGKSPLGPVLFYDLKSLGHVPSGSKYHATEWRNVPDYQGGFLLDGGVHPVAMLRVALGDLA